jgi:hypothetical protein
MLCSPPVFSTALLPVVTQFRDCILTSLENKYPVSTIDGHEMSQWPSFEKWGRGPVAGVGRVRQMQQFFFMFSF